MKPQTLTPAEEKKLNLKPLDEPRRFWWACFSCGNSGLSAERPKDRCYCGDRSGFLLLKHQNKYIVGCKDYIHPRYEIHLNKTH